MPIIALTLTTLIAAADDGGGALPFNATERAVVAIVRSASWSPDDPARDGAEEFLILMQLARLGRSGLPAGLVCVGNRHGFFLNAAERALRVAAQNGIPIAKLARSGELAADPDGLFLDASHLDATEARSLLIRCLEQHGAPPAAAIPERPTPKELHAIRAHLQPFRDAFALTVGRVAAK